LSNLLSNAAKFSPAQAEIEVGAELRGTSVRVFVRDHGDGIPEDFAPPAEVTAVMGNGTGR